MAQDALQAIKYIKQNKALSQSKLLVLGQSYGGQLAIKVAAEYPRWVDAMVIEGAFTSFEDIAAYSSGVIAGPFTRLIFKNPYSGVELIQQIKTPKLIIHSKDDPIVPVKMAQHLYDQAGDNKELWLISGKHIEAYKVEPVRLIEKIDKLLGLK